MNGAGFLFFASAVAALAVEHPNVTLCGIALLIARALYRRQ